MLSITGNAIHTCECTKLFKIYFLCVFFFQAEDGIRDRLVTGVQTCALPILPVANRNLNLPLYPNSNIGPVNNAPIQGGWNLPSGAQTYGSDVGRGGWANEIPGVTYLQSYKNRDGTREDREVGTFGSMLDRENRRFGLGGGGAGGGVGVSYY